MSADLGAAASGDKRAVRARQKAAQLRAEAEKQERFAAALEKGNDGERHVAGLLDVLDGAGWVVLNDRYKSPTSPANIDHIAVGPPGVFVVDSKNWSGSVRLDARGMASNGYRRDAELLSARTTAEAVQYRVGSTVMSATTAPVLAFVQDVGIGAPTEHQGVVCLQESHLLPWLTTQPVRLTPQEVQRLGASLDAAFPPRAGSARPLTVGTLDAYRHRAPAQRTPRPGDRVSRGRAPAASRSAPASRGIVHSLFADLSKLAIRLAVLFFVLVVVVPLLLTSYLERVTDRLSRQAPAQPGVEAPVVPDPAVPAAPPPAAPQ